MEALERLIEFVEDQTTNPDIETKEHEVYFEIHQMLLEMEYEYRRDLKREYERGKLDAIKESKKPQTKY